MPESEWGLKCNYGDENCLNNSIYCIREMLDNVLNSTLGEGCVYVGVEEVLCKSDNISDIHGLAEALNASDVMDIDGGHTVAENYRLRAEVVEMASDAIHRVATDSCASLSAGSNHYLRSANRGIYSMECVHVPECGKGVWNKVHSLNTADGFRCPSSLTRSLSARGRDVCIHSNPGCAEFKVKIPLIYGYTSVCGRLSFSSFAIVNELIEGTEHVQIGLVDESVADAKVRTIQKYVYSNETQVDQCMCEPAGFNALDADIPVSDIYCGKVSTDNENVGWYSACTHAKMGVFKVNLKKVTDSIRIQMCHTPGGTTEALHDHVLDIGITALDMYVR